MAFHWYKELVSTNDEAKQLAKEGAPHGTMVGTDFQTAGRGRSGKSWQCQAGEGLMCSVILRPEWDTRYWGWIALSTGLVLAELLERDCLRPKIKYPNDILVNGKKIAGILSEANSDYVVVGIGMNLNMASVPRVESAIQPTSFYLETDCKLEAQSYAATVQRGLMDVLASPTPLLIRREIEKRLAWYGEEVSLINRTEKVEGIISGLGEYGQLLLEVQGKEEEVFDAHEIRAVKPLLD